MTTNNADALTLATAQIVAAAAPTYTGILVNLIKDVRRALIEPLEAPVRPAPELVPAVAIKKSITPDYLVSLETGERFKSLKRHLGKLGMTPEQYRAKWNLPADYPMVAASYSAVRSKLAKDNGLGRKNG